MATERVPVVIVSFHFSCILMIMTRSRFAHVQQPYKYPLRSLILTQALIRSLIQSLIQRLDSALIQP